MIEYPIVCSLRAEYHSNSPWVVTPAPRLSWRVNTSRPDWIQASAEIEVTRGGEVSIVYLEGRDSVFVPWPVAPLEEREIADVRVRVRGQDGIRSAWSETNEIRSACLDPGKWAALPVGSPAGTAERPALFRRRFHLPDHPVRATLYTTGQGVHQSFVNGVEVDDERLKPGWTSYRFRRTYETADVTALLRRGSNAVGLMTAGGWWTERFGFGDAAHSVYGDTITAEAMLVIELASGDTLIVATDALWKVCTEGPIIASSIYQGENYDARQEIPAWADADFDDREWPHVLVHEASQTALTPRVAPPVRANSVLTPVKIRATSSGRVIVDFGQNVVGHVRIRVVGPAGTCVTLRHAEVMEDGELSTRPLRAAAATDRYVLGHDTVQIWEPRFTFHGFRYVELEGWPGALDLDDIRAIVVGSDMLRTGWFETSHALLSRLHENVVWSMRGNFLAIPTDCPQRDERLGWTGDIQAFAPTASFLYDCDGFLAGWLQDLAIEQSHNDGVPPLVVPDVLGESHPAAAWGDAAVIVPTVLYERFDDLQVLAAQYDSMRSWCERLLVIAGEGMTVQDGFQFGDWLDPTAPPEAPGEVRTDPDLVASAYFAHALRLTSRAARMLNLTEDAERYDALSATARSAFAETFATGRARLMSDSATAYALAIVFELVDERTRLTMGERLAYLCRSGGYRLTTGFVGTPIITDALSATGHRDVAVRLLLQTENPSWLYPVTMGATTCWERWDSMLEDGTVNPGGMTSFNHYALGSIADWLHRDLGGIIPLEPGYRSFRIAPHPTTAIDDVRVAHDSAYGLIEVAWRRVGSEVEVDAVVPPNTTATVELPGSCAEFEVGSGVHRWVVSVPISGGGPAEFSINSTLADVIDDSEAYGIVLAAYRRHDPGALEVFRKHTRWTPGNVLVDALNRTPLALRAEVVAEFQALNAHRMRGNATAVVKVDA